MAARESQRQASALQSISAGGQERTVGAIDETLQKKLGVAIAKTAALEAEAQQQRAQRDATLKAVAVTKDAVDAVADAFEISRAAADTQLRLHGGDVAATMRALVG